MALRDADAIQFVRLKATLTEGDHNAVIREGTGFVLLPVLFRKINGKQELFVEYEDQFYDPRTLPGFVRLERMAEEIALEQPATPAPEKPTGSNWLESKRIAEEQAKHNLAAQQATRRESNGIGLGGNSKWQTFSDYARRERNAKFGSR